MIDQFSLMNKGEAAKFGMRVDIGGSAVDLTEYLEVALLELLDIFFFYFFIP